MGQTDQPTPARPRTVLLVEDNATDIFVIQRVLGLCNLPFGLRIAKDGHDAVLYLKDVAEQQSACPELVLLDLNVPKVNGLEVLRQLRTTSPCNRVPVIVVTSSSDAADRAEAQRLGADAYFQKPTDLTAYMDLVQLIRRVVKCGEEPSEP
jgi:CheY-like chemotaxis protein